MLHDFLGSALGALAFSLALFAPGYLVGHLTDICRFRSQSLREQAAWSVLLSFSTGTLAVVAVVWLGGAGTGAALLLAMGIAASSLAIKAQAFTLRKLRPAAPYFAMAMAVFAICSASLADVGLGSHLYMSVTAYDNALRAAFVQAVVRSGVPPPSPVYWPGHDAPMHYYYYWYVVCAAVAKLAHISAKQALIASSAWAVYGVLAALALFGRHALEWRGSNLRRRWWIATALLTVTGCDGLIALVVYLHSRTVARDVEWWSLDQVTSWADTFLWVPHHAAALVCCLGCLLLVGMSLHKPDEAPAKSMCLAGLSLACAFGLSTYVAFGTVLVLACLFFREIFVGQVRNAIKVYLIAGAAASVAVLPFIVQLLRPQPGGRQTAGGVLRFGIRELLPPVVLADFPGLRVLRAAHPYAGKEMAAALLLAPSYFLELGFFAIALITLQRKRNKTWGESTLLFLAWAGLILVSVVRSQVIAMNDYSVRATLLPQFFLLLIGVLGLETAKGLTRLLMVAFLVIGTAGSVYQMLLLRTFLPLHERSGDPDYEGLAERNYLLRDAYTEAESKIPLRARVQFSVPNGSYTGFSQLGNVGRQIIVESNSCNDSFGGEVTPCAAIQVSVATLFSGTRSVPASEAVERCKALGAEYLAAASWDPVWKERGGWVWTLPVVVAHPEVRIVSCARA